jgi:hypothetical protein
MTINFGEYKGLSILVFIEIESHSHGLINTCIHLMESHQLYINICHSRGGSRFQDRGAHLKKLRRAERGAKNFGVFRVKKHDFKPNNHIFSNFRGGAPGAAPWIRPCIVHYLH